MTIARKKKRNTTKQENWSKIIQTNLSKSKT